MAFTSSFRASPPSLSAGQTPGIFTTAENPVFQNGAWVNGGVDGGDWYNMQTTPGKAFGTQITPDVSTIDNIAHLKATFNANQSAQAPAFKQSGYAPTNSHENGLYLRLNITLHSATGYEINCPIAAAAQIVRWNGVLGDFTVLTTSGIGFSGLADGDVVLGTIVGSLITVYLNSVSVLTATDTTWTTGHPGMGAFVRTGGTLGAYGWKSFTAANL